MALIEKLSAIGDAIRVQSGKTELLTLDQMPSEIINLQSLNFEVVGNPQPSNPKENTIWVNTDTEITSWYFSETQLEAFEEGMVWFSLGANAPVEFNPLKENGIQVRPVTASQYINGALEKKTAQIYQDGKWKDWVVHIYNLGWVSASKLVSYTANPSGEVGAGGGPLIAVSYSDGEIVMTKPTNWNGYGWTLTDVEFDLASVNTIYCETGAIGSGDTIRFGVGSPNNCQPAAAVTLSQSNTVYSLDVSSLTGSYRVGFFGGGGSSDWNWQPRRIRAFWY